MLLSIPVSVGEVMDKITILEIKAERINDSEKHVNVKRELNSLKPLVDTKLLCAPKITALVAKLKTINETLWEIEDDIRERELAKDFGDSFIALARAVYITNDQRAEVKRQINLATGSTLIEEKSYENYC